MTFRSLGFFFEGKFESYVCYVQHFGKYSIYFYADVFLYFRRNNLQVDLDCCVFVIQEQVQVSDS